MARFNFAIPGRSKKQAAPIPPPLEPMSKAQRILGSDSLSPTSWEDSSASGISASVPETVSSSSRADDRSRRAPPREWGDDSDVVPRHLRYDGTTTDDEAYSQDTRAPREQASSSTIKSWYDKSKQPLAISQQTSASAMAKGLPSKAQRLLDMENIYSHTAQSKGRKKPSRLDLSRSARSKPQSRDADSSPRSVLSPLSTTSPTTPDAVLRSRRKLTKHPTHESLRRDAAAAAAAAAQRPATSASHTRRNKQQQSQQQPQSQQQQPSRQQQATQRLNDISTLYRHYEQMSFAQFMGDNDDNLDSTGHGETLRMDKDPAELAETLAPARDEYRPRHIPTHSIDRQRDDSGPLNSHPMQSNSPSPRDVPSSSQRSPPANGLQHIQITHPPRRGSDQLSPTDCGASVSSRHTRTSKASFQASELQDKSVLMLSSDSEEDEEETSYVNGLTQDSASSTQGTSRSPVPGVGSSILSEDQSISPSMRSDESLSPRGRHSSQFRAMSSTPTGFFTIGATHFSSKSTSPAPSTINSRETVQRVPYAGLPDSKSNVSLPTTNSSVGTSERRKRPESYGIQQARCITLVSARGPRSDKDTGDETDPSPTSNRRASARQSNATMSTQTASSPPLSPTSMEFYIQPAQPESANGQDGDGLMGLTQQEKMLIHALRQRRKQMRRNSPPEGALPQRSQSSMGHMPKVSENTITEDFDFPAPPSKREARARAMGSHAGSESSSMVSLAIPGAPDDGLNGGDLPSSSTPDGTLFVLSPPSSHSKPAPSKSSSRKLRTSTSFDSFHPRSQQPLPTPPRQAPIAEQDDDLSALRMELGGLSHPSATSGNKRLSRGRSTTTPTNLRNSLPVPPRPTIDTASVRRQNSTMTRQEGSKTRRGRTPTLRNQHRDHWDIVEEEIPHMLPSQPETETDEEPGIPRPDSPISPMTVLDPPARGSTMNKPGVRLSAFGPPPGEFAWWGDED